MIPALDIRTLSVATAGISLALCCYMLYFQASRKTYSGFRLWTLGTLALGAGMLLVSLRGLIPDFLSIIWANIFIILEIVLVRRGLAKFAGQTPRRWPDALFLVIYAGFFCWFTWFQPSLSARIIAISIAFACYMAWSAWLTAGPVAALLGSRNWLLLGSLFILGVFHALRAALTILHPPTPNELLAPSALLALTLVFSLSLHILIVTGLVMLNVQRLERDLAAATGEVKILSGLLPICSSCKRIRDEQGGWQPLEAYISRRSQAEFTHGICPECLRKHYPQVAGDILGK